MDAKGLGFGIGGPAESLYGLQGFVLQIGTDRVSAGTWKVEGSWDLVHA